MTIEESPASLPRPMQPISHDNLLINFTTEFHRLWSCSAAKAKPATFWRPDPAPDLLPGYFPLGDLLVPGETSINGEMVTAVVCEKDLNGAKHSKGSALAKPVDFELIWKETGASSLTRMSIWRPISPVGYVALGMVCSSDHNKPSYNAVRCVRTDLVVPANIGDVLWNDKGTGAKLSFSAWTVEPPTATAGEIHFAAGTFIGAQAYSKPATPGIAYALRMQIPIQSNGLPQAPELADYALPTEHKNVTTTQIARLPWFVVRDHIRPAEQFHESPYYQLKRTDEYVLIGYDRNTSDSSRVTKWTAARAQNTLAMRLFNNFTAIELDKAWPARALSDIRAVKFSARLPKPFTYTEHSSGGWSEMRPQVVIAMVAKQTAVAVYQIESHFELVREDGAQVAVDFGYTDDSSVHLTQYPRERVEKVLSCAPLTTATPITTEQIADDALVLTQASPDLPTAIDTAP